MIHRHSKLSLSSKLYDSVTPCTVKFQLLQFLWADSRNIRSVLLLFIRFFSSTLLCLYFFALTMGLDFSSGSTLSAYLSQTFYSCFFYFFSTVSAFLGSYFLNEERVYLFPIRLQILFQQNKMLSAHNINQLFHYQDYNLGQFVMATKIKSAQSIIVLFLASGFFYTFSYKLQGSQTVQQGLNNQITKKFFHPYMQGLTFFVGQILCLLAHYFFNQAKPRPYSSTIFIIPAASDLFSVMLQCSALAMISGSSFMMLKGASIVTTLIFARFLIKLDIRFRHIVGCGLAVIGLAVVGLADIWLNDNISSQTPDNSNTIGYVLMVTSLIFNGFLYAYEQKLLQMYQIGPLQMVGWEGVYGSAMSIILILVVCFIPCPYTGNKCVYNSQGEAFVELPSVYFRQVFSSFLLFVLVIAGLVTNAFYNYYGVTITKTMDGLTRSLLNVCRTALIWVFGLIISFNVTLDSPYHIESLKLSVNFVKLIGFFCIITGTLTYNKVLFQQLMAQYDAKWLNKKQNNEISRNLLQNNPTTQIEMLQIQKQKQTK